MAVKRYNGSSWDVVAGVGAQGAAATSSTITTWVKTASGGETSLSGNDDNSQSLSYTVGQELVFINGTLLKRGSDYTATNGTSITGLTALAANDVATVWTVNAFSVTGAIANTIVDAKGDLLVGTAADTPGRLAVGTDGQYLKADSTSGTGLAWTTLPSSGKVLQVVYTETATVTTTTSGSYVDVTNLAATITPSSTSSKILVLVEMQVSVERDNYPNCGAKLLRGSTAIVTKTDIFTSNQGSTSPNGIPKFVVSVPIMYLDSPATTSSTTYKMQISLLATGVNGTTSANGSIFGGSPHSSITLLEIGA